MEITLLLLLAMLLVGFSGYCLGRAHARCRWADGKAL